MALSTSTYGQKYAHVNLGNLLTQMPEMEASSKELQTYQEQLTNDLQQKVQKWEKKVTDLQGMVNNLTPIQVKEKEAELLKEQEQILKEEQELTTKFLEKRNTIMAPIIAKAQDAIKLVGREKGFTMIFDTSVPNLILFAEDMEDVSGLVLEKLGIKK